MKNSNSQSTPPPAEATPEVPVCRCGHRSNLHIFGIAHAQCTFGCDCKLFQPAEPPSRGWCRKCRHRAHEGFECASGRTGDECPCAYEELSAEPVSEHAKWLREYADYLRSGDPPRWNDTMQERARKLDAAADEIEMQEKRAYHWNDACLKLMRERDRLTPAPSTTREATTLLMNARDAIRQGYEHLQTCPLPERQDECDRHAHGLTLDGMESVLRDIDEALAEGREKAD